MGLLSRVDVAVTDTQCFQFCLNFTHIKMCALIREAGGREGLQLYHTQQFLLFSGASQSCLKDVW